MNRATSDSADSAVGQVAEVFSENGWDATRHRSVDLEVRKGDFRYIVEVKHAREVRSDRTVPLVAQAVLQARHHSRQTDGARPLVVMVGTTIPPKVVESIKDFMATYADDVAIGMIDSRGLREFVGPGLEPLNQHPSPTPRVKDSGKSVGLFSDLNQWMLKVLLAADVENPQLLNAPIARYRNATELARASRVSIMTAFRFLEQLSTHGYLHESSPLLRLVRLDELMERWKAIAGIPAVPIRARWLLPGDRHAHLRRISQSSENVCIRSYAAADALGLGIVRGVPTDLYVRAIPRDLSRSLGLVRATGPEADVALLIPNAKESIFRGAVHADGIRASDVLQVWLDVSADATRGREQANHIHRTILRPMLKRAAEW